MNPIPTTVTDPPAGPVLDAFDVSALWGPSFPTVELVSAAAALLTPLRSPSVTYIDHSETKDGARDLRRRYSTTEGGRARIVVGPGCVQIARVDPARAERALERVRRAGDARVRLETADLLLEDNLAASDAAMETAGRLASAGLIGWPAVERIGADSDYYADRIERRDNPPDDRTAKITAWSRKSRANMVRTLAQLDYAPLFATGGIPAMLTLTYPGEWLAVAPSPAVCKAHLDTLKKRFRRAYGRPLVAVWKREFQRRGAPHYHLLMVPPHERANGLPFAAWVARTWAEIVGAASCTDGHDLAADGGCCERIRHGRAGTGLDYAEGTKARDPKRLAVYFSKHGAYADKEYQNQAPAEWADTGSVGRFWGVWGLERGTAVVEVTEVEALAAARTLRRWQRANGYRVQSAVHRRRWNTTTGELRHSTRCGRGDCEGYCFKPRKSGSWSGARMRGKSGFVVVNDGAALVSTLARHLDAVREAAQESELAAWAVSPRRLRALDV